jgi:hypothetical protein
LSDSIHRLRRILRAIKERLRFTPAVFTVGEKHERETEKYEPEQIASQKGAMIKQRTGCLIVVV